MCNLIQENLLLVFISILDLGLAKRPECSGLLQSQYGSNDHDAFLYGRISPPHLRWIKLFHGKQRLSKNRHAKEFPFKTFVTTTTNFNILQNNQFKTYGCILKIEYRFKRSLNSGTLKLYSYCSFRRTPIEGCLSQASCSPY